MKRYRVANYILFFSFIVLLMAVAGLYAAPSKGMKLFYFFAQSCFIGSFADWFAVESLFRNRLHLPFFRPVVEVNRKKIMETFRHTVKDTLLPQDKMLSWVKEISLLSLFRQWYASSCLSDEKKKQMIAGKIKEIIGTFVATHEEEIVQEITEKGRQLAIYGAGEVKALVFHGNYQEKIFHIILEEGKKKILSYQVYDALVNRLERMGEEQDRGICGRLLYWLAKTDWLNVINYDDMATAIQDVAWKRLDAWDDEDTPFHQVVLAEWNQLVQDFLHEEDVQKALGHFLMNVYESCPTEEKARAIVSRWKETLKEDATWDYRICAWIHSWQKKIENDEILENRIDEVGRHFIHSVWHTVSGEMYAGIYRRMETLSAEELNEFIESRVHKELEGIRINGAVVGAAAGLCLYGAIEYFYIPIVLHLITN